MTSNTTSKNNKTISLIRVFGTRNNRGLTIGFIFTVPFLFILQLPTFFNEVKSLLTVLAELIGPGLRAASTTLAPVTIIVVVVGFLL